MLIHIQTLPSLTSKLCHPNSKAFRPAKACNARGWSWKTFRLVVLLGVSKNRGNPQIIHFNRVFHYKPSILGYPLFLETPIKCQGPFFGKAGPDKTQLFWAWRMCRSDGHFFDRMVGDRISKSLSFSWTRSWRKAMLFKRNIQSCHVIVKIK